MKQVTGLRAAIVGLALFGAFIFCAMAALDSPRPRSPAATSAREAFYTITGSADRVSLTLRNSVSGTEQQTAVVPYRRALVVESGDFLYISAQIESRSGEATCKIIVDGVTVAEATARGFARIATCSASAP